MVNLDLVRSCNDNLIKSQPLVAVFVGGTAGIGEYSVRALAAVHGNHGKGLRVYIVGRNKDAAERVTADCLKVCPTGQFRFVCAKDLSLLKDVDRVCNEIMQAEEKEVKKKDERARLDFLVMTQGYLAFQARQETKEGFDTLMSLLYYSRMRFIMQLLPLLLASPLPGRVVSVFGPGRDDKIFPDDLSLRDPKRYNFMNMGSHVAYMTTFFQENLASKHPERLSLSHYYPSLVMTNAFHDERLPKWFKYLWFVVAPIIRPFTVTQRECGERVLFHTSSRFPARPSTSTAGIFKSEGNIEVAISSDGIIGDGAYRVNWNGESVPLGKEYKKLREENMSERVWNHTMEAFEEIECGNIFTG